MRLQCDFNALFIVHQRVHVNASMRQCNAASEYFFVSCINRPFCEMLESLDLPGSAFSGNDH